MIITNVNEPVSVSFVFDSVQKTILPRAIVWNGRLHAISKVGLHHKFRNGRILYHVFSVASNTSFFRLILNTDNLHWKLESISDGLTN